MVLARAHKPIELVQPIAVGKTMEGDKNQLLSLCLRALSQSFPQGLTARELVDEINQMDPKIQLTSSLLSSKLNAVFRRFHGDGATPTQEQLQELPMTRRMTDDKRKRLIYHYVQTPSASPDTPASEIDESEKLESVDADEAADAAADAAATEESAEEPAETPTEEPTKGPTEEPAESEESEPTQDSTETAEVQVEVQAEAAAQQAAEPIKEELKQPITPTSPSSPKRKLESPEPVHRKKHVRNAKSFNLYYDSLTLDSLPPAPQLSSPNSPGRWADEDEMYVAPETVDLNELDACC